MVRSGLVWSGLVWSGLVRSGLVWSGLFWSGLVWSFMVRSGLVWSVLFRYGLVWSGPSIWRQSYGDVLWRQELLDWFRYGGDGIARGGESVLVVVNSVCSGGEVSSSVDVDVDKDGRCGLQ